jgi:hypothetical protein
MQSQTCLFCGHIVKLIHVHGHYQCPVCNTNALPCCDGDNCDTNMILNNEANKHQQATDNNKAHTIHSTSQ